MQCSTNRTGNHPLLVENHPLNAKIAKKLLEKKGIIVVLAENGKIAVNHFKTSLEAFYAAIHMDMRMPVMGGLEATRTIRKMADRADAGTIPIIAMTANAFDEDVNNCLAAGMNAHLAKPIEPEKMFQTIANALR